MLMRMRQEGFITAAQEKAAAQVRPRIRPYPGATEARHGYAKEFLRQQFRDRFGGDHPPDWTVRTTFVPELQDAAEREGKLALCGVIGEVKRLFEIGAFTEEFLICPTQADGIGKLRQ